MNTRSTNQAHNLTPKFEHPFQQVSIDNAAAETLGADHSIDLTGVKYVELSANAEIRYTDQGALPVTAPTATVGHVIAAKERILVSAQRAARMAFIATGASPALLNISFLVE